MCFIPIIKQFLIHWSWLQLKQFTWTGIWAHGGCDQSTGDAYSSWHLIPPLVYPGFRVLRFVFPTGFLGLITVAYLCYFILLLALMAFSNESYFTCYTGSDKEAQFIQSHPKDQSLCPIAGFKPWRKD
jgi:hypothetical protein